MKNLKKYQDYFNKENDTPMIERTSTNENFDLKALYSPILNFKERLDTFADGFVKLLDENTPPPPPPLDINFDESEMKSEKELETIPNIITKDLRDWCKEIYEDNKERIDALTKNFQRGKTNEEICITALLSLGLIAISVWLMWPQIKRRIGEYKYKNYFNARRGIEKSYRSSCSTRSCGTKKLSNKPYSSMNQTELEKEMDKALDSRDKTKMREIGKYIK